MEKKKRLKVDSICYLGYKCKTSVTQTDLFDWWEPIYLDGLSTVSKFISPQVPSSISVTVRPSQDCQPPRSYLILKLHTVKTLSAVHFFCTCIPTFHGSQLCPLYLIVGANTITNEENNIYIYIPYPFVRTTFHKGLSLGFFVRVKVGTFTNVLGLNCFRQVL